MKKFTGSLILVLLFISSCSNEKSLLEETIEKKPFSPPEPEINIKSTIYIQDTCKSIDYFFYDLKGNFGSINDVGKSKELFEIDKMNGVRIPIFGDAKNPAHPEPGIVDAEYYQALINSIKMAKNVRNNKPFYIFASKKLRNQNSFPEWVKDENGIIPSKYAIMLADFFQFMKDNGIEIDYLGIDNEFVYNEGNITPVKYIETINELENLLMLKGITIPKYVGYEDYGPNKRDWLQELINLDGKDKIDIYGTHYYPQWRPKDKLEADLALIPEIPFWSTEPHWDNKRDQDELLTAEAAIVTLWDQTDSGMTGFMWWNYELNSLRGKLMRAFSVPLLGATPIRISDPDGQSIDQLGKLQSRAFKNDNTITVYLVNMSSIVYENYRIALDAGEITGNIEHLQWTDSSNTNGNIDSLPKYKTNSVLLDIPSRSINRLTIFFD